MTAQKLITVGENENTVFRSCKDGIHTNVFETICAFLNTRGGTLLLGVDESGEVYGFKERAIPDIIQALKMATQNADTFQPPFEMEPVREIVVTNCESGQAEYYSEKEDGDRLMQLCRASSSMPLVTPMVEIDGVPYLDGGIADSIPLIHSMRSGYRKNVLILTRSKGYRKTISKRDILMYQTVFKDYPNLARALCRRARQYNEVMELVERWEEEGRIFVIRPQGKTVSRLESKPEVLEDFYQHGIEQMKEHFGAMQDFLEK